VLNKMHVIRDYLNYRFPVAIHDDEIDFDRYGHKFRIVTKDSVLLLSILASFIDDSDIKELAVALDGLDIVSHLKNNPESTVIIRKSGVSVVPRNSLTSSADG
jgi:hypothetical protein